MQLAENDGQVEVETTEIATDEGTDGATLQTETEGEETGKTTDDEEEHVVTIGEEAPPSDEEETDAPGLVNKLRKLNREKDRELRELRAKATAPATQAQAEAAVVKPTLADCDYDEEVFAEKLTAWHEDQAKHKTAQQAKEAQAKAEADAWKAKLAAHGKAKTELKVRDYEEAEAAAAEVLSVNQQGIIVNGADNSALVVYALGKNPAKAKELASIKDPVKFAFAIAKLETTLKVTQRKAPPPPEKVVRGSAPVSAGKGDAQLAKLEAEAERTGDRSKIAAYRREQRRAQS